MRENENKEARPLCGAGQTGGTMSVYKSKRGTSAMQFIETARQLEAHTFACCIKAPKRYSFS